MHVMLHQTVRIHLFMVINHVIVLDFYLINESISVFLVVGACVATKLGSHPTLMLFEVFSMLFIFYSVHWQAYCSGIINFQ